MDNLTRHFGLIIAYLLPGFVALIGVAGLAPTVGVWLHPNDGGLGIGPPVYAILAALAAGMIVSCFRWLLIDPLHHLTGVADPIFNAKALEERPSAFSYLVEAHYRYYQFYANTLVAVIWTYTIHRVLRTSSLLRPSTDLAVLILCGVLFVGSRDALSKYRNRSGQLVATGALSNWTGEHMTNGIDHHQGDGRAKPSSSAAGSAAPRPHANQQQPAPPPSPEKPSQPKHTGGHQARQ
jgi:hypothetical protein